MADYQKTHKDHDVSEVTLYCTKCGQHVDDLIGRNQLTCYGSYKVIGISHQREMEHLRGDFSLLLFDVFFSAVEDHEPDNVLYIKDWSK